MSYKAVEFAVEQSLSDLLFHVDSQERPVPLPEKTLVPPKRKWRVHMQPLTTITIRTTSAKNNAKYDGVFSNVSYKDFYTWWAGERLHWHGFETMHVENAKQDYDEVRFLGEWKETFFAFSVNNL